MKPELKKNAVIVDNNYLPESLKTVFKALVNKALNMTNKEDNIPQEPIMINVLENYPRSKNKMVFSNFVTPNIININIQRHFDQMISLAHLTMRCSTILWYELLTTVGHELYHLLVEYPTFVKAYDKNIETLQIEPKYDCDKAEQWGKELILAVGYEISIDPPDDWGLGMVENDIISKMLSDWQASLPHCPEPWAKRQQTMIDENLTYLDDEEETIIKIEHFHEWLYGAENNWINCVGIVQLETVTEDIEPESHNDNPTLLEKNLEELYMSGTQVSDLEPLRNLKNLERLNLNHTQVSDLEPLRNLKNLKRLNLNHTQVSDLEPLRNLKNLERLNLNHTQVSDLEPLKELRRLTKISADHLGISDINSFREKYPLIDHHPAIKIQIL